MSEPNLEILERNLELLLRHAYVPAVPEANYRKRLHARILDELASPSKQVATMQPSRLRLLSRVLVPLAAAAALVAILLNQNAPTPRPTLDQILESGAVAWRPLDQEHWVSWSTTSSGPQFDRDFEVVSPSELEWQPTATAALGSFPSAELQVGSGARLHVDVPSADFNMLLSLEQGGLTVDLGEPREPLPADELLYPSAEEDAPVTIRLPAGQVRLHRGRLDTVQYEDLASAKLFLHDGVALVRDGANWVPLPSNVFMWLRHSKLKVAVELNYEVERESAREEILPTPSEEEPVAPAPAVSLAVTTGPDSELVRKFRVLIYQVEDQYNVRTLLVSDVDLEDRSHFAINELSSGVYALDVVAPGLAPWRSPDFRVEANKPLTLSAHLEQGLTVRGRVFDPDGNPLADATVLSEAEALPIILSMDEDTLGRQVQRMTKTDEDGFFELSLLRSGETVFRASHADFAPGWSSFVVLQAGQEHPELVIQTSRGGTIRGRVETELGVPAEGEQILASLNEMSGEQMRTSFRQVATDAAGEYVIGNLPAGFYALLRFQASNEGPELNIVEVHDGEVVRFDFAPAETGTRLFGRLTDDTGAPLARIGLSLARQDGTHWNDADQEFAIADNDGNYEIPGINPGHFVIYITRDFGTTVINIGEFDVPHTPDFEHNVELSSKSISGTLLDAVTGKPARNCFVALYQIETPIDPGIFIGRQVTREDGRFFFHNVREYYYRVTAQSTVENYGHEVVEEILPFESGAPIRIELRPGGTISLKVEDANGLPIIGANLIFLDENGHQVGFGLTDRTSLTGSFSALGVRPGTWNVTAAAEGYLAVTEICRVAANVTEELSFVLTALDSGSDAPPAEKSD